MKKSWLLILLISAFFSEVGFSQDKPANQSMQEHAESLRQVNEGRLMELQSLENVYDRLYKDYVIRDSLIDVIISGVVTRSTCVADCGDGTTVSCSGIDCLAVDDAGCGSTHLDGEVSTKICGWPN